MGRLVRALTVLIGIKGKISGPLNKISKGFKRMAKKIQKSARNISRALRRTLLVITGLAAVVAIKAVSAFMKFDTVMRNVFTLLPEMTQKGFQAMSDAVLELSKRLPKTPEDLGAALYDIVSAGVTRMADALGVLELAAKAAAAGVTTTKIAAGGAIAIMNAFGKTADDIESILDSMFATVRVGVITFEQISAVVGKMASQFNVAGLSINEMLGGLAFLTKVGISAAEATTGLSRSVQSLVKQRKEFKAFGVSVFDVEGKLRPMVEIIRSLSDVLEGLTTEQQLSILQQIVPNIRALNKAILPMIGNLELYEEVLGDVADSHEALNEAAQKQLASLETRWNVLKNNIQAAFIRLGKVLGTVLGPILEKLTKKINKFTDDFFKDEGKVLDRIETFVTGFVTGLLEVVNTIITLVNTFQKMAADITVISNKIQIAISKMPFATPFKEYEEALGNVLVESTKLAGAQKLVTDLQKKYNDNLNNGVGITKAESDALDDARIALGKQKEALDAAEKAVRAFTEAEKSAGIPLVDIDEHLASIVNLFNKARTASEETAKSGERAAEAAKKQREQIKPVLGIWQKIDISVENFRKKISGTLVRMRVEMLKFENRMAKASIQAQILFTAFRGIAGLSAKVASAFLMSFKKVALEFGASMLEAILPTADLLMEAIQGADPEETVKEWVKGVVKFIEAIARNMPALIDAFIDAIPKIIDALINAIPDIITAILSKLPDILMFIIEFLVNQAPRIALAIVEGLARGFAFLILKLLDVLFGGLLRFLGFDPRKAMASLAVPQAQTGGLVEQGGLVNVHQGEQIVPAEIVREGGGGGDTFIIKMSGPVFLGDRKSEDDFGRRIIEITDRVKKRFK